MAVSARVVRAGLLLAGVLLVVALAGYILRGRIRMGHPLKGLAHKLGADIDQESDHFSYSQSLGGRTVYTIHAAKEIQHHDGTITLHDVGIVLYGKEGDRADRISGTEFDYDRAKGVLHAVGDVYIDLQAPAGEARPDAERMVHIKTSGLVFLEKEQAASTDAGVEFESGGLKGQSTGASYDAKTGVVILRSAVRVTGVRNRRPILLTASRVELDRQPTNAGDKGAEIAVLERAVYVSDVGATTGAESAAADHAVVQLDESGSPRRVDARGHVSLGSKGRGNATGDRLEMELSATGQPRAGHLYDDVRFTNEDPARPARGSADDARVQFDAAGLVRHVTMTGAVRLDEKAGADERQLQAARVDLVTSGGGKEPLVVRDGRAFSVAGAGVPPLQAWLRLVDPVGEHQAGHAADAKAAVPQTGVPLGTGVLTTDIKADSLLGRFSAAGRQTALEGLDGSGHTVVERVAKDAAGATLSDDTSTGDTLKIDLNQEVGRNRGRAGKARLELSRAEQHGSVHVTRVAKRTEAKRNESAKVGTKGSVTTVAQGPLVEHGRADTEVYDAATDVATLTGSVELSDEQSTLLADRTEIDRKRGLSTATGSVRISYLDQAGAEGKDKGEPVHVVAARAISTDATHTAVFYAAPGGKARLWQGGSQVEAPVLEFNREQKTLLAHGAGGAGAPSVRTLLVSNEPTSAPPSGKPPAPNAPAAARKSGIGSGNSGPVRVLSDTLRYNDGLRQALFSGHVRMDNSDGTVLADEATAYLAAAARPGASPVVATNNAFLGGRLERVVGTGHVSIRQPGRIGTGERIVYTATDATFVLTGTPAVLPRVVDEEHGTVTGPVLRFRSDDQVVFVEGDARGGRVQTDTKIKQ